MMTMTEQSPAVTPASLPAPRPARASLKRKLATAGTAMVLSIIAAELFCRLFLAPTRYWFPPGMYETDSDPLIGYRLTPNFAGEIETPFFKVHARVNSLGFRGAEPDMSGRRKTIAVLGDSFAFGAGVEEDESFTSVLRSGLDANQWQVMNAATYGYSPAQEYRTYQKLIQKMRIDVVVLQLCDNDVMDQSTPVQRAVYHGTLMAIPPRSAWEHFKADVIFNSEFAARLRFASRQLETTRADIPPFMLAEFEQIRAREIESTQKLLGQWIDQAAALKQKMFIVYIPDRLQVEPGFAGYLDRFRKKGKTIDMDAAQRWLVAFLKDRPGATYIDVTPALRAKAQTGQTVYLRGDTHNNPAGNQIIGQEILKAVQ
jgi:lysophospholipase L1-like esterase